MDAGNPKYISQQIIIDNIIKVYDHHTGFENFWKERGQIEFIGACATMIYELFKDKTPTTTTANLLSTAIFSNTLNFKSKITRERDIKAYNDLKQYTDLPDDWVDQYYNEVEAVVFNDILSAIKNDTKILPNNIVIGQMELWKADKMLNKSDFLEILNYVMKNYESWFMNMPSIKYGKTYFVVEL